MSFNPGRSMENGGIRMPHSFTSIHVHCVFSTKNREPWIHHSLRPTLYQIMGGIANKNKVKILAIGGIEDHIHILLSLSPVLSLSNVMQFLKAGSSHWIHETFPESAYFSWQEGYGAFSIGVSQIKKTKQYISNQEEHHRKVSFQDEINMFLEKHGIQQ